MVFPTWGRGRCNGEDPDLGAMADARVSEPVVEQLQQLQQNEPVDELLPSNSRLDSPQDRRMHMLTMLSL
jgi:hypothetical protein